jgi:S-methyl-5-thioribose-1-phosphate isomerase
MRVNGENYRTIWMEESVIRTIDQSELPHSFKIVDIRNPEELKNAINNMIIRGAGAIGAAGGYGMVQAAMLADKGNFFHSLEKAADEFKNTRPTAQSLFAVIDRILQIAKSEADPGKALSAVIREGKRYADMDADACRQIGRNGAALIKDGANISTHCNAGWLAFVDWGTALSPVYYAAKEEGKRVFVYVDETRPRCQGSKLTAWELLQENIPHTIIADNVSGSLMRQGKIDLVIVGADRIAINGDVANKIGTYPLAVCAKENGIPFYVAAPAITIDPYCQSGDLIPIEERSQDETLYVTGMDDNGKINRVKISPDFCTALNIGFDVTPAKYISGIITELGVFPASREGISKILRGGK